MHEPDRGLRLRTLGALALAGAALSRPKPLLLLAYVALEGRQSRRHLAELFFAEAAHPLQSLSVALSRLRQAVGERLSSDERTVEVGLHVDTADLFDALERGDLERAGSVYRGAFLEGVDVHGIGVEVEEWIYDTREFVASQVREARLRRGEAAAAAGRFDEAGSWAEAAWATVGAAACEPEQLTRLHDLVLASGQRVLAARIASEARGWGIVPAGDTASLRARFRTNAATQPSSLPTGLPEFVGRAREREAVQAALLGTEGRLVTLMGPGGIGKTRLALQVAHDLETARVFADGVSFVSLEDVPDDVRVATRVAEALDVVSDGHEPAAQRLTRALRDRRALIVLDDAEHVQAGVAELVAAAADAVGVRWLVTSRERLQLRDEMPIALGGLDLPDEEEHAPNALLASDAVALFVRRRRSLEAASPHEGLGGVARLCRAVGGWPLALEIAASLTRVMTIEELADELESRLDVLVDPGRDVPERHHSMLGVLDATWQWLAEPDREALRSLAVFRGGFSRVDAEAVVGVGVSRLARLVDRALVRPVEGGRFDLHPLVWRYAWDRLRGDAEAPNLVRAHARHFLGLLARSAEDLGGSERDAAVARLLVDHANVREAWTVAVRSGDDASWGAAALGCGRYLDGANRYREGVEWLREARERSRLVALGDDVHAALALGEGSLLARLARFDEAAAAIAPAVTARDARVRALAHETLAQGIELWRGSYAAAGRHLREAEALYRELGDVAGGARCTFVLANIAWVAGDWTEALALLRAAREVFRGLADRQGEVITTAGMGVVEMDRGNLTEGRRLLEHARRRATGSSLHLRTIVAVNLAHVRLLQGDVSGLEAELAHDLEVFQQIGDDPWVAETASYAARAAILGGQPAKAGSYLRAGLDAALRSAHVPSMAEVLVATGFVIAASAPDDAAALFELVRDHPLTYANTRQESASALALLGRQTPPATSSVGLDALVHPGAHAAVGSPAPMLADPLTTAATALLHDGLLPSGRVFELAPATP